MSQRNSTIDLLSWILCSQASRLDCVSAVRSLASRLDHESALRKSGIQARLSIGPEKSGIQARFSIDPEKSGIQARFSIDPEKSGIQARFSIDPEKSGIQVRLSIDPEKLGYTGTRFGHNRTWASNGRVFADGKARRKRSGATVCYRKDATVQKCASHTGLHEIEPDRPTAILGEVSSRGTNRLTAKSSNTHFKHTAAAHWGSCVAPLYTL
ncbi:hypothetical protein Bbelb_279260 [Branchiostoma belcheri]|nr:hypothetical protein Bbelb_279260 [Branchiostoma belcheri]